MRQLIIFVRDKYYCLLLTALVILLIFFVSVEPCSFVFCFIFFLSPYLLLLRDYAKLKEKKLVILSDLYIIYTNQYMNNRILFFLITRNM